MKYFPSLIGCLILISCSKIPPSIEAGRKANIKPAYSEIVIPYNIAPLNFSIDEQGKSFIVLIHDKKGAQIFIRSSDGNVSIPVREWKNLLASSKNDSIYQDIYCKTDGEQWLHYATQRQFVSAEPIDPYIVYRNIGPVNLLWQEMSIDQRCIENFKSTKIADNKLTGNNCMNCHLFNKNDPEQMMFHMRVPPAGTIIKQNNQLRFLNTATDKTMSAGVYPAWHPSGKYIAFSTNTIHQSFFFKTGKYEVVEDDASDIELLDLKKNRITTCPAISTKMRENLPTWSPDGKYMYYILGNPYCKEDYQNNRYDLMRIPFDEYSSKWGTPETILMASKIGKSVSFPDISPDGKWLLFCMSDYGYFTIYNPESDIYLMNLETHEYKRLPCNSDYVESYPTWSSNGKWIMFVSKQKDNLFSRPWFCHFDKGIVSAPFILPQENPRFNDTYLRNYNRPEFVTGKVSLTPREVYQLSKQEPLKSTFNPAAQFDGLTGATSIGKP